MSNQRRVDAFFGSAHFNPARIVDGDLSAATILDWSTGADRNQSIADDQPSLGRYGQLRSIYDTEAFATPFGERRTLHLGIDVFVPDGRPVYSPLDGVSEPARRLDLDLTEPRAHDRRGRRERCPRGTTYRSSPRIRATAGRPS